MSVFVRYRTRLRLLSLHSVGFSATLETEFDFHFDTFIQECQVRITMEQNHKSGPIGQVLHAAGAYDLMVRLVMLGREGAFVRKFSDWRAWSLASRSWTWAAGPEPLRSRPNGMSGRPARCMGSMRRRRCLREQATRREKPASRFSSRMGLLRRCRFPTLNSTLC